MPLPDADEIKRKAEIDRLLSRANYYRIRHEYDLIEQTCGQLLEIDPGNLLAREWLADVLHERGQLQEAADRYRELMKEAAARDSAETKYARVLLEIDEQEREKALAQEMLENPQKFARPERSPLVALLLSIVAPGFGHLYLGEMVKGGIVLGVFVFSCIALALSPDTGELLRQFLMLITMGYGMPVEGTRQPIGYIAILFSGILVFTYIYAVIDAPLMAAKSSVARSRAADEGNGE